MNRRAALRTIVAGILAGLGMTLFLVLNGPAASEPAAGKPAAEIPQAPRVVAVPSRAPVAAPAPKQTAQGTAAVDIVDGKTLDFSPGVPIVRDSGADKIAMDKALAEIDAARADVQFAPVAK